MKTNAQLETNFLKEKAILTQKIFLQQNLTVIISVYLDLISISDCRRKNTAQMPKKFTFLTNIKSNKRQRYFY